MELGILDVFAVDVVGSLTGNCFPSNAFGCRVGWRPPRPRSAGCASDRPREIDRKWGNETERSLKHVIRQVFSRLLFLAGPGSFPPSVPPLLSVRYLPGGECQTAKGRLACANDDR